MYTEFWWGNLLGNARLEDQEGDETIPLGKVRGG
jgi:hypothetical protein